MSECHQLRLSGVWRPSQIDYPLPRLSVPQMWAGNQGAKRHRTPDRMTCVRRFGRRGRLTFISQRWEDTRKARLSNKRPGEDAGRSVPPQSGLVTYVFSGSDLKSFSVALATAVSYGAFVASRRRAHTEVIQRMQPDTSDERISLDVQQQPVLRLRPERGVLN